MYEPRESIAIAAEWLANIRHEVGLGPVLGIDYHHRLSVAEAASFCQRMPSATLDFLEEPIRDETPDAYRALRDLTDVPFAIGEEFASKWQFLPYIEQGLTQFARLDICNVGGFTEAMKVAGWAEAHYIDLMPTIRWGPSAPRRRSTSARPCPTGHGWRCAHPRPRGVTSTATCSRCSTSSTGHPSRCRTAQGWGSRSTRSWRRPRATSSGRRPPHLRRRDGSHTNW